MMVFRLSVKASWDEAQPRTLRGRSLMRVAMVSRSVWVKERRSAFFARY